MSWRDEHKCEVCGQPLGYPKRYDAKYCGPNCRKTASRRVQKVADQGLRGLELIHEIRGRLTDPKAGPTAREWLEKIVDAAQDALKK